MIAQCQELLRKQLDYEKDDPDSFIDAAQNARLMASAERYFMYYGDFTEISFAAIIASVVRTADKQITKSFQIG